MGDAADFLDEQTYNLIHFPESHRTQPNDPIWTTRDGKKIRLSKMDTSHIQNCIKMLQRRLVDVDYELQQFSGGITAAVLEERNSGLEHDIKIFEKELNKRQED